MPPETCPGETGHAVWRTLTKGGLHIRMVEYSPGYRADHWCDRGDILFVASGELESELSDGRVFRMRAGMRYALSDFGATAHRASTRTGATLFIID